MRKGKSIQTLCFKVEEKSLFVYKKFSRRITKKLEHLKYLSRYMVESSDKMWSTGEGNGKSLPYSCLENPMNSMKRQKNMTLKDELPRSVGAQNTTGEEWRNNSRKNEEMEPKQKQCPVVDVTGNRSKV